jgi:hypothetical protein
MADEADLAFNEQETNIKFAIAFSKKENIKLKPIGECHYCGEPFTSNLNKLFCNPSCEKSYIKEQELIRQNSF